MKISVTAGRGVLVLGMCVGGAMAGMGADGGFDADMMMHFPLPKFLRARASSATLFAFSGALGGIACQPVTATGDTSRPFSCNGNTFTTFQDAAKRSCDDQQNACSNLANNKSENTAGITVSQCGTQQTQCISAAAAGPQSAAAAAPPSTTSTSTSTTTTPAAAAPPATTTTTAAAAAPPPQTTTAVQAQPQTTTQQAAAPVVVASSTPQAVPVQASSVAPSVVQSVVASIASPSATLHSSDENFFYFCDP